MRCPPEYLEVGTNGIVVTQLYSPMNLDNNISLKLFEPPFSQRNLFTYVIIYHNFLKCCEHKLIIIMNECSE